MKTFESINLNLRYRSGDKTSLPTQFYNSVLPFTKTYDRAVGFFSSSSFLSFFYGINEFIKNEGKIRLITSPRLSEEDVEAIKKGYEAKKIYLNALTREMKTLSGDEIDRFDFLTYLIETDILEIKIATTKNPDFSMYHEKIGLFKDFEGNVIAISGSNNESENALEENFESFDVFCSWKSVDEKERISVKEKDFEEMWENHQNGLEITDFPEFKEELLKKYKTGKTEKKFKKSEISQTADEILKNQQNHFSIIPKNEEGNELLYDYQNEAIENWLESDSCGIFDMATGTGKTFTGLGALTRLSQKLNHKLAVIICCPYQHLVEQWCEDIDKFNMKPIVGYGNSFQKDWKKRLENAIELQKIEDSPRPFFCFISTNATFSSEFVQSQIDKIKSPILLMIDEAHNFGASFLSKYLDDRFKYRLALSATLERHGDEKGTQKLYKFFGKKCIEYTMERAIKEKKLTPYKYYPIPVFLTADELDEFHKISKEVSKCLNYSKDGKVELSEKAKILLIKRARLIAGAEEKIEALREQIEPYKEKHNLLVYCGATKIKDENENEDEIRQITAVTKMLGLDLEMSVRKFTSEENIKERQSIKEDFVNKNLQAIVAIKCLDEGVNIPGIETAFILASTTNPKEYIQRRGRVLRLSKGKEYAEIYDFVTLPRSLDSISGLIDSQMIGEKGHISNEIRRINEFGKLSKNPMDATFLIEEITESYDLDLIKILEKTEEDYE